VSKEYNISLEAMKEEVFGKNYNNSKKNYKKFTKSEQKPIEKIKNIENGEKFVEETFIRLLMENKELRLIALLKISEEDFLINESKEIFNLIIKNKELDKITIDKIKSLNISEEYVKTIQNIPIEEINTYTLEGTKKIIDQIRKNIIDDEIKSMSDEIKQLSNKLELLKKNNDNTKEVDDKIMNLSLEILKREKIKKDL
ncbi:MAG: DNA primase, partial [Intestinibacter sp.]